MDTSADRDLVDQVVVLAAALLDAAIARQTGRSSRRRARMHRLLVNDSGTRLIFSLADRVMRPFDAQAAATQLAEIVRGDLSAVSGFDRALLRSAVVWGRLAPRPVIALAGERIRLEAQRFVAPAETRPLARRLEQLRRSGRRANLNVLGEAVLGWGEARRRRESIESLLRRPGLDCVSVKVSAVAPGLSLVDFEGSIARAADPLRQLYRTAAAQVPTRLVNLDMEEHRDLDLTVELFTTVLDEPEFANCNAGIALQAYLPDSHAALDRLLSWAASRHPSGATPIRIRLVKGANLAMEHVEAELQGWPAPTYPTKLETDASYKSLLERLIAASAEGIVTVGVASHNLFDIAFALVLSERLGGPVEIEMLAGMADEQADAVVERVGGLLLYVPVTLRAEFRSAMAYLARRLDENVTPDGFLRHALELEVGSATWKDQASRFTEALLARHAISTSRRQTQNRAVALLRDHERSAFSNEPDTDLTVPANRAWAVAALRASPLRGSPTPATRTDVDEAVARALGALDRWAQVPGEQRRRLLRSAADRLAEGRGSSISVMAHETGKTFSEADTEVSEAIDYARWYAESIGFLDSLAPSVDSEPLGVVVVAPPWNFPFAIPAGGVLAALAAGNTVILKPSPEARATSAVLVEQLHDAGIDPDCLSLVPTPDDDAGHRLITHPDVGGIVLTGSWDTAVQFARWTPRRRLLGETSGKNAMVVSANADVDAAVRDLVRSAFAHAGQKCSAASVAIVDASIHDRSPFLRQLADATQSLRVGVGADPATEVGPIVGPMTPALVRALTSLDAGEEWLVEPRQLDGRLWSPGVRIGVRRGSWAQRTEWFGPVLAVIRVEDLDEAIRCQNDVEFGLTAGLQSLDPVEHQRWIADVEAGNLYINRHTTGAIVGRQPFGGWKRSSFGPTTKAGGPNYLLGLRRWHDRIPTNADEAAASYAAAMREHFSTVTELASLSSESNELRYRPLRPGVIVRVGEDATDDDIAKAAAAAAVTGTPVRISSARARPGLHGLAADIESGEALGASLRAGERRRLRLLGRAEQEILDAAAEVGVTVLDEPMCSNGRLELVRWLREQSISRSLHRYGNVVYPRIIFDRESAAERETAFGTTR